VGRALRTRNTPHLEFVYDTQQEEARRISRLIDQVAPPPEAPADTTEEGAA
jgi:ribosome-binding factor A